MYGGYPQVSLAHTVIPITINKAPPLFGKEGVFSLQLEQKEFFVTFYRCDNTQCGMEFIPAERVVWVANRYTVCCVACKAVFFRDNQPLVAQHLRILGVEVPTAREALLRVAAIVL